MDRQTKPELKRPRPDRDEPDQTREALARGCDARFWADLEYSAKEAGKPLRSYQETAVESILRDRNPTRPRLIHIATGGGKTRVANTIVTQWQSTTQKPALWVTKDWRLLQQAAVDLRRRYRDYPVGRIGGDQQMLRRLDETERRGVVYTTVQTLVRKLDLLKEIDPCLLVWDECHWGEQAAAGKLLTACKRLGIPVLGRTATPRESTRYEIAFRKTFYDLVNEGFLARPVVVPGQRTGVVWIPRMSRATGDIAQESLDELAANPRRNEAVVTHYLDQVAAYGKTIIFACNKKHCNVLAGMLVARGIAARPMHSDLHRSLADRSLREFHANAIQVLVNVEMLTHGIDVPDARTVFLCRPTMSDVLLSQMIGRAARLDEATGKTSFNVVEFTDNVETRGDFLKTAVGFFRGRNGTAGAAPRIPVSRRERRERHTFDPTGAPTWTSTVDGPDSVKGLWYRQGQTFGLEFELTAPGPTPELDDDWLIKATAILEALEAALPGRVACDIIDGYAGNGAYKDSDVWNVEYDSSAGWEVTSPILADEAGLREVDVACQVLVRCVADLGLLLDARTSTHLHLGWSRENSDELKRAIRLAKLFEPPLATLVAPSGIVHASRGGYDLRRSNRYCAPLETVISEADLDRAADVDAIAKLVSEEWDRNVTFNIKPLWNLGTVEVRLHSGTVEARKILMWVSLWQQILWAAVHRKEIAARRSGKVIRPDGDIIDLAMTYLPEARQAQQRLLLRRLAARRDEVVRGLWATHPALEPWLKYEKKWVKISA